jgi:hypothetical protein
MNRLLRSSVKTRVLSSRLGSLLLLFQRSPVVQMLFPEARVLGGAGIGEIAKWTVATVAGLGAYDTVAGATTLAQLTPNSTPGSTAVTAAVGSPVSFVVQCTGAPGTPGSWTMSTVPPGLTHSNSKNSTTDSLSGIPTTQGSYSIIAKAWENSNFTGGSSSKTFTMTVGPAVITTHPASLTINSGTSTTLTVVGSGTPLAYQWYQGASGITTAPIVGATSASYTTPALAAPANYWVKVTRGTLTTTTNPVVANSATAAVSIGVAPVITTQPAVSTSINAGGTTTLSVAASGTPTPTYQWYVGSPPNVTTPASGPSATTATYTTPALATSTSYWAKATNTSGSASSNAASVTVNLPATISTHPASVTINSGSTATLSVIAGGTGPFTYQWYQGNSGITTTPVGSNSSTYTTNGLNADSNYWVKVTNAANPGGALSNTAIVTVNQPAAIVTHPASVTINSGGTTTLSVTASGTGPLTYQWYQGTSPAGTNSSSFTTPALGITTTYWVKVTNVANPSGANSNVATVTVNTIETFANWQSSQFTPIQLSNPLVSGPTADPDGDGITNEKEYIFGLLPLTSSPSPSPSMIESPGQLTLRFTARAATGAGYAGKTRHYSIESSDSLGTGSWSAIAGYQDIVATGQTVSCTSAATAPRKFYQLRVWLTP